MKTTNLNIVKYLRGNLEEVPDEIAVEDFLEIYVDGSPYAVTMRTPGDDRALAAGFCLSEGIVDLGADFESIEPCSGLYRDSRILVNIRKEAIGRTNFKSRKKGYLSKSSCGLCGKAEILEIYSEVSGAESFNAVSAETLFRAESMLKTEARLFDRTGAFHCVAVFNREGNLISFGEDIGRHNAVDKCAGRLLLQSREREAYMMLTTSRLSFEMVQKAGALKTEILAGVSAPTSLAVEFASRLNITLVGFLRGVRMNVYTHPGRISFNGLQPV